MIIIVKPPLHSSCYNLCVCVAQLSLFVTPWTVDSQASLSMGFSRQEYGSELPFPSPGDLSNPGIESGSPALRAGSVPFEPPGKPGNDIESYLI